jgi:predicted ATPase
VKYLGPLRDEPKPVYPLAGATDPKDVGYRGEHTAAVLELHKNTVVKYVPSEQFCEGQPTTRPSLGTLHKSVLDWLQYMGIVSDVRTFERGSLGHELHVSTPGGSVFHDLTHVGVGVSQVLPILVLSLLAESGSVLIFEQPELHLHPRVQTRLADFFVSMTTLGKQCIVETHSEYLINQLRYRAAVSHDDAISKSVIMYFVEKQGPSSKYRTIRINRFGVIEDWPKGFFDENEENASRILRAGVMKRKQEGAHSNAYPTT